MAKRRRLRERVLLVAIAVTFVFPTSSVLAQDTSLALEDDGGIAAKPPNRVSPETAEAARFHEEIQARLQERANSLGSAFAGAWVDPEDRNRVVVSFKGQAAINAARADPSLSPLSTDARVRFKDQRFSQAELVSAIERVTSTLKDVLVGKERPANWPFRASILNRENVVDVVVDSAHLYRQPSISDRLAPDVETGIVRVRYATIEQDVPLFNTCTDRAQCQPLRGGLRTAGPQFQPCSTGFLFRNSAGTRYNSTAGHCSSSVGDQFFHNYELIGPSVWRRSSGNVDAMLIDMTSAQLAQPNNSVFRQCCHSDPESDVRVSTKISTPGATLEGNLLCSEGGYGGERCGVLESWNSNDGTGMTGLGRASLGSCGGDSGGAVVAHSTDRAYGIVTSGFQDCRTPSYFTWTAYIEQQATPCCFTVLLRRATERLKGNQSLRGQYDDQYLDSPNGQYFAKMQSDGNFVTYGPGGAIWSSNTAQYGTGSRVIMQSDGNMVIYKGGTPVCSSNTAQYGGGSTLRIQDDGNLVIYDASGNSRWVRGPGRTWPGCYPPHK